MQQTSTSDRHHAEEQISAAILSSYFDKLKDNLQTDVIIAGAGPSGLVAARDLALAGYKVTLFERKLAPGGGTWGGGMLFNEIVVQSNVLQLLDEFNITWKHYRDDYYTVDAVEFASGLIFGARRSGAVIFNAVSIEDIVFDENRVGGAVILWTPVERTGMHVDPLVICSKAVLDSTGHPSEIAQLASQKAGIKLNTTTGTICGEKPMWVDSGEAATVTNTGELYPGLFVSGMAANNVHGGFRMGPVFGGMLLSGRKAAQLIAEQLGGEPLA